MTEAARQRRGRMMRLTSHKGSLSLYAYVHRHYYEIRIMRDRETGKFTGQCIEIRGAIGQGSTVEECFQDTASAVQAVLVFTGEQG